MVDAHQMKKFFVVIKEVFPSESPDWRGLVMLRYPSSGTNCALDSLSLWRPRRPQLRFDGVVSMAKVLMKMG